MNNVTLDIIGDLFLQLIEKRLIENNLDMEEKDKLTAAKKAEYLYVNNTYSSKKAAAKAALIAVDTVLSSMRESNLIVKKVSTEMQRLMDNFRLMADKGILGRRFVNRILSMPAAVFINEFLDIVPETPMDIEVLIRVGYIAGNCIDCTDSQGWDTVWAYSMNGDTYIVEACTYSEIPFEQQVSEEIFVQYKAMKDEGKVKEKC